MNRKGFTLVELLAVIIILAIVVGITIPAVLTTTNKARQKAFDTAVDAIKTYIQDQVDMAGLPAEVRDSDYNSVVATAICTSDIENECVDYVYNNEDTNVLNTTGYYNNISAIAWTITNGKVVINCVIVNPDGDYISSNKYNECR